jgi:hypothetical protein
MVVDDETWGKQYKVVRDTTRNLIESAVMGGWPRRAAIVDFGIDSEKHYEALYHPIREGEIGPKELDEALGHGEKLTELTRRAPSNPHKDVEFHTAWDVALGRNPPYDLSHEDHLREEWQKGLELFQREDEPEPER